MKASAARACRMVCAPLFAVLCGACTLSPGGPEYAQLGVSAANQSGLVTDEACTTLPVLPGGELLRELTIGGRFSAQIAARRDRADVSFEGIIDAADARRGLSLERLRQGYAEELDVETLDGETYSVFLHAPCTGSP